MSDLCHCDALTIEVHEHCLNCECILGSQGDEEFLRPRPADMPALMAVKKADGTIELKVRDDS
jgi:hypothetical protein